MSVLFCVRTNSPARGGRGRGHAAPGCSCRRGAGVSGGHRESRPPAASAFRLRERLLSSHDPGPSRARPAPTRAAEQGKPRRAAAARAQAPGGPSTARTAGSLALGRRGGWVARVSDALRPDAGARSPGRPPAEARGQGLSLGPAQRRMGLTQRPKGPSPTLGCVPSLRSSGALR